MANILAVYGTAHGHTERIARRIAGGLRDHGEVVTLARGDHVPSSLALEQYDAYIIAASVIGGRHQRYIERFVRRHVRRLNVAPSAFVSVCGAAAGVSPADQAEARRYVERFLRRTGWTPQVTQAFGGCLAYTQYGWVTRWVMKRIAQRRGRPTDTSRDHDLTDWQAVDRFTEQLVERLVLSRATRP